MGGRNEGFLKVIVKMVLSGYVFCLVWLSVFIVFIVSFEVWEID